MQAGEIYQAEYSVSGLATMISSTWQQDALSNVQTNVENNGGQVVYIALDDGGNGFLQGGTITVQFKQAQSVEGSTTSVLSTQSAGMRAVSDMGRHRDRHHRASCTAHTCMVVLNIYRGRRERPRE